MTKLMYLADAYQYSFESTVTDRRVIDGMCYIALAETFFYPHGGGQPCDFGQINQAEVDDVTLEKGIVWHRIKGSLEMGAHVSCSIDIKRRRALMQQHSGQHLLSALALALYDAHTVGFHIGEDYVTVDLDQRLNHTDVEALQKSVNDHISSRHPIRAFMPSESTLEKLPLRKKPKVADGIRVVEIDTLDFSPCGGLHVSDTLGIQLLKIYDFENHKQGVRLYFSCGEWAIQRYDAYSQTVSDLKKALCVPETGIVQALAQTQSELKALKGAYDACLEQNIQREVDQLIDKHAGIKGLKWVVLSEKSMPIDLVRQKVSKLVEHKDFVVAAVLETDDTYQIILSKSSNIPSTIQMNGLFKKHLAALGVRGGGNEKAAQGGSPKDLPLEAALDTLYEEVMSLYTLESSL